jgi:hypothetical protein
VAREAFKLRAEWVERSFALILDRGGMRRTWLRGRENIHKRYLILSCFTQEDCTNFLRHAGYF